MKGIGFGILVVVLVVVVSSVCFGFTGGFIENVGQVDGSVRYYVHGSGMSVYFADRGLVLDVRERVGGNVDPGDPGDPGDLGVRDREAREGLGERVRGCAVYIYFEGCSEDVEVVGRGELGTRYNYFIGSDPSGWRTGVPAYEEIVYRGVWEGVDLVYRIDGGNLEYEVVGDGVDLGLVRFRYEGAELVLERDGFMEVETGVGRLVEEHDGYIGMLRLVREVGEHAGTLTDPPDRPALLLWSTFLGGSDGDEASSVVVDAAGNPVVTGVTWSSDFPTTPGTYDATHNGNSDVFVAKLSSSGDRLLWGTFLGGSNVEGGFSIVLDGSGNPVLTGETVSSDFCWTRGAYDTTFNGGVDVFVTKLSSSGDSLLWSTYLGGDAWDGGTSLVLDSSGNPLLTGRTRSSDFPTTPGAYDTTYNGDLDAFVAKLSSSGDRLLWGTFIGGWQRDTGLSLVLDGLGSPVVIGYTESSNFPTTPGAYDREFNGGDYDVFVSKFSGSGDSLLWSTFLGGTNSENGSSIVLDASGNPVLVGYTGSTDFPTTPGAYDRSYNDYVDVFVSKLSSSGDRLLWSTFLGGRGMDIGSSLVLDASGDALVAGFTSSSDFPTTQGAYDTSHNGNTDVFLAKLRSSGDRLLWSTFLGGRHIEEHFICSLALDASGNPVLVGETYSSDFPTSANAYDRRLDGYLDAFVAKLSKLQVDERQIPDEGRRDFSEDPVEVTASVLPDGWQPASQGELVYTSFPNPFTAGTRVYFSVSHSDQVSIKIYDVKGELVRVLVDGRYDSGTHDVIWDGRGDDGVEVASGVYFIQMEAGGRKQTQRVVVLR